jgi:hypothetical protein
LEPRTVLSAILGAVPTGLAGNSVSAHELHTDHDSPPTYLGSTLSSVWKREGRSTSYRPNSPHIFEEQQRHEAGTRFGGNDEFTASEEISFPEDKRLDPFRNVLPVPSLSFTIYSSSSQIIVVAFPEDRPRKSGGAARLPPMLWAPYVLPSLREPVRASVGPPNLLSGNYELGSGMVGLPNAKGGLANSGLFLAQEDVSLESTRPTSATSTRDSVFEVYDPRRLLLAASTSGLVEPHVDRPATEVISAQANGAGEHIRLDSVDAIEDSELVECRLVSQLAATDEVLRSLSDIGELIHDSATMPRADHDPDADQALTLAVCAANRLLADDRPSDDRARGELEGGMILLSATGDPNDGVCEIAATDGVVLQLDLLRSVESSTGVRQEFEVAGGAEMPNSPAQSTTLGEPRNARQANAQQAEPSAVDRPSQRQATMLVGAGAVLAAVHWRREKRPDDPRTSAQHSSGAV